MNRSKICPSLLNVVEGLNLNNKNTYFLCSNNFTRTKKFLNENNYQYKAYRFADCFCVDGDYDDLNILSNLENITFIHSNIKVQALKFEKQIINIENLTKNEYLGQDQTVCFIDTGLHPHLDFIFPTNRIVKFIDLINNNPFPYDDNGHGTFVTGIACGNGIFSPTRKGFAPKANIIAIKALGKNGNSNSNTILDAMQWVYENHKAYNIKIVCMSFGADVLNGNDPLSRGAEALWKRGITVIAAAGNSGPNKNTIKSPGNNPFIITVGGLDSSSMTAAEFSSRGPTIYGHKPDLLAPAVNVTSCNSKALPYANMSGTSVATPIIAGICADVLSRYPNFTNDQLKNFLLSNCKKITGDIDIEGAGYISF